MKEFKAGDKVYFPMQTTKVCTLIESSSVVFPLSISAMGEELDNCTTSGMVLQMLSTPNIFHATQENRELLEKLYGVGFESPPPQTVSVTLELPEPFEPKLNEIYWYLNVCGNFDMHVFQNDSVDKSILFKWRTEGEVRQALKTLNATFGMAL